jgi:hypothetical protein
LWIPLAIALMIVASHARLPPRVWILVSAFVVLMATQTIYLRNIAIHVPLLEQSQFVWRLMLPTAFVAFGALVAGWRAPDAPAAWTLAPLALLSVIGMFLFIPGHMAPLPAARYDDTSIYAEYLSSNNVWGVRLFAPNYSQIPKNCEATANEKIRNTSFSELRTGVNVDRPFISVQNGPIGLVEYNINGDVLRPSACQDKLVLGPLKPNGRIWVTENRLNNLLHFRILGFVVGLSAIALVIPFAPAI